MHIPPRTCDNASARAKTT